jgi:hypothetical protein
MTATLKSRYQTAQALERTPHEKLPERGAVRFESMGYKVGTLNGKERREQIVIRFAVHAGQAVEVALSPDLASRLGADLVTRKMDPLEGIQAGASADVAWSQFSAAGKRAWLDKAWAVYEANAAREAVKLMGINASAFRMRLLSDDAERYERITQPRRVARKKQSKQP